MILNQAQATAVYDAMCYLNNVGGTIVANVQLCSVREVGGRWVMVEDHTTGEREEYDGQHLFAAAYGVGQ